MKPISMHQPVEPETLRMNVQVTGALAVRLKAFAEDHQLEPAAALRLLAVEGLKSWERLREVG